MNPTKYKIEKGIPITPKIKPSGRPQGSGVLPTYPFNLMEIGDSFLYPCTDGLEQLAGRARLQSAAYQSTYIRNNPRAFVVRIVPTGVRCWRTK